MFLTKLSSRAEFNAEKMGKTTLAQGEFLFAGLNCFEPGQEHTAHAHQGQDKLYVVLEGRGVVQIGDETRELGAGDAAFAPSRVVHSIRNTSTTRLVVMAVLGPPPRG